MTEHRSAIPAGATDCHFHLYDAAYPAAPGASLQPPDASVADFRALQRRLGTSRGVLVQPSTYGTDNRLHLAALAELGADRFRMVAVVPPEVTDAELRQLDAAGVRGVRFNLRLAGPLAWTDLVPLARRVAPLGWHLQVNIGPDALLAALDELRALPCRLVLDHLGHVPQPGGTGSAAFAAIRRLLDAGHTWVKLSAPYLSSALGPPDYADAGTVATALAQAAPDRLLWGSDWPHPSEPTKAKPDDAALLDLLRRWVADDETLRHILVRSPAELYGFT